MSGPAITTPIGPVTPVAVPVKASWIGISTKWYPPTTKPSQQIGAGSERERSARTLTATAGIATK